MIAHAIPAAQNDKPVAHAATAYSGSCPWSDDTLNLHGSEFQPGAMVGDYIIEELRSRGGFAAIYRAHHHRTGEPVAIKVLHRDFASYDALRRFEQEAETLRRIDHPHVVKFLDYGQLPSGQPYLVLEWLEGRTLAEELCTRGPLAVSDALAILEELGAALGAAHALGVVHRDIKAANVMVIPRGDWFSVKLVDFGIVKLLDPVKRRDLSSTLGIIGTPLNMAPEQILGQRVDARTDVYGLGLLLYQLVTGQLPFWGGSTVEVEELHLHAAPPRPSSLAPVSEALDAVVARCLEKRMEARYPSVGALLVDLRAAVSERRGRGKDPQALGVHVEARIDGDLEDPDDDVLDDVEEVLELAEEALASLGLGVVLESGNALLTAAILPAAEDARRHRRAEILAALRDLELRLEAREGRSPHVRLALTVHAASGAVCTADPSRVSGEILRVSGWTGQNPNGGVVVTEAALEGLEDEISAEPVAPGYLSLCRRSSLYM